MALLDAVLLVGSFRLAYTLRASWPLGGLPPLYPLDEYTIVMVVAVPICLVSLWLNGVYRYRLARSYRVEVLSVARALAVAGVVLATLAFLLKWQFLSRSLLVLFLMLAAIVLLAFKLIARVVFRLFGRRHFEERNVLLVGGGEQAGELVRAIREHYNWGLRLLGWIPLPGEPEGAPLEARRLGVFEDLQRILDENPVDEAVFSLEREKLSSIDAAVELCEQMGIRTRVAVKLSPRSPGRLSLEEFHGVPLITLSSVPDTEVRLACRRVLDLTLATILLALTAPLLAVACLLIKLEGGGPILFRQVRSGLNGRRFTLLKLRTMVLDADRRKGELLPLNEMSGPVFKIKRDPRVTRVGAYLRRFSIDELPQLLNVLSGHMALVGPRPPVPEEVSGYERWQRRRLSMKPGMTGLWQVSGRSDIDFDEWMKLDLRYIDNWSLWLDLKILLKTLPAVLSGRGAQ